MAGPFGGPMAGPGECSCCTSTPGCPLCITITGQGDLAGINVVVAIRRVTSIPVVNGGSGYTSPPVVTVNTVNTSGVFVGSGATAVAVMSGSSVDHINVINGGGYSGIPSVSISIPPSGTRATATATLGAPETVSSCLTTGKITLAGISVRGTGYTGIPGVSDTGTNTATYVATMRLEGGTIVSPGSGYAVGNILNITGGTRTIQASIRVTAVNGTGGIAAIALQSSGGGYSVLPANPATGTTTGAGAGGQINLTWAIDGVSIIDGGNGYTANAPLVFSGGGGSGATGTGTFAYRCCTTVPASGRYQVSTDACTPAASNVDVVCPGGANISIAASGSASVIVQTCGTCTNNLAGSGPTQVRMTGRGITTTQGLTGFNTTCTLTFAIARPGTYTFALLDGGCYQGESHSATVTGCSGVVLTMSPTSKLYDQTFHVVGCAGMGLQGATVTLSGSFSGSATTDADGNCTIGAVPADCSLSITITYPRFVAIGPSPWRSPCSSGTSSFVFGAPISGYYCTSCVSYPLPGTLFGSDSEGVFSLSVNPGVHPGPSWSGCHAGAGKTGVCYHGVNCRAKQDLGGNTIFTDGVTASIGWTLNCDLIANKISGNVPGYQDENGLFDDGESSGWPYFPVPGCCTSSPDFGGAGWVGDAGPCSDGTTCHSVGLPGGCSAGLHATLTGGFPMTPPFHASYLITSTSGLGFPSGVVNISE